MEKTGSQKGKELMLEGGFRYRKTKINADTNVELSWFKNSSQWNTLKQSVP